MTDDDRILVPRGYQLQEIVGHGAYSQVKSAYSTKLSRHVAIKCIDKRNAPADFVNKFLPRELSTLPKLAHRNIVKIYEILSVSDGRVYIIMDYAACGDLLRYIQKNGALTDKYTKTMFSDLTSAVAYLHAFGYCHRDLKCENILLVKGGSQTTQINETLTIRLTDFGFSRPIEYNEQGDIIKSRTFCGSAAYAAPEIIQGKPYDPRKHDSWSLGVILYIMICGTMPYDDANVRRMLKDQLSRKVRFPPRMMPKLCLAIKDLIHQLICTDPESRMEVSAMHRHPWLYNLAEVSKGGNGRISPLATTSNMPSSSSQQGTSSNLAEDAGNNCDRPRQAPN